MTGLLSMARFKYGGNFFASCYQRIGEFNETNMEMLEIRACLSDRNWSEVRVLPNKTGCLLNRD